MRPDFVAIPKSLRSFSICSLFLFRNGYRSHKTLHYGLYYVIYKENYDEINDV
jgi:hypothetical protein